LSTVAIIQARVGSTVNAGVRQKTLQES